MVRGKVGVQGETVKPSRWVSLRYQWCSCACGRVWDQLRVDDIESIRCECGRKPWTVISWDSPDDDAPVPMLRDGSPMEDAER